MLIFNTVDWPADPIMGPCSYSHLSLCTGNWFFELSQISKFEDAGGLYVKWDRICLQLAYIFLYILTYL
jgi:hypothetical protein